MGDSADPRKRAMADARERVDRGIAHIAVAVVYPANIRDTADFKQLRATLKKAELEFAVCAEAETSEWRRGNLDAVLDELRRGHDLLAQDDVLTRSVEHLQIGMSGLINVLVSNPAAIDRIAKVLGVHAEVEKKAGNDEDGDD
ncbi:MAG TPA: hypothetical protein VGQ98_00085 [Gemmatimonadaceae bacterium]|nr:hypothetical protein [Gemmatimonadaceae bacterium]